MDVLPIEYHFADAMGIARGKRGEANDADGIRAADPKYLVKALDKAIVSLRKRAEKMKQNDKVRVFIDPAISDLEMQRDLIEKNKAALKGTPAVISLWWAHSMNVHLIDIILRDRNL